MIVRIYVIMQDLHVQHMSPQDPVSGCGSPHPFDDRVQGRTELCKDNVHLLL